MFDNVPDRDLNPPEGLGQICELCGDDIPVDSKSWCFCDECLKWRAEERERQERNKALIEIARNDTASALRINEAEAMESYEVNGIYECAQNHLCRDIDIPPHGLDIYCPTCGGTLDCVGELEASVAERIVNTSASNNDCIDTLSRLPMFKRQA